MKKWNGIQLPILYFVLQCRFAGLVFRLIGASKHLVFSMKVKTVRKTSPNRFKTNSTYSNKVSEFHFSIFTISSDKANFLRNKATPTWTLSKPCESFSYAILPVVLTFNKRSHIAHGFDTKLVLKTRFQQQQQLNFSLPLYNDLIDKSQNSGNFCLPEMSLQ